MIRKRFNHYALCVFLFLTLFSCARKVKIQEGKNRPNILFVIADDQSFPYASAYGTTGVKTPAFDEVAKNGILFTNAFVAAPQCSPSRAAILTGKNIWQLAEAGTHGSNFPKYLTVFTNLLEKAGYKIGYTGKPWAPGNWKVTGWKRNPVGPEYNKEKLTPPTKDISNIDYFRNFVDFYNQKKAGKPFFFWFGAHEPHRTYKEGSGVSHGLDPMHVLVPDFLPDTPIVRSDIDDYIFEIEWYDKQLGKVLHFLKQEGELDNTLIVVTSDNGMPFPSAKANLLDYGIHVPLAISWPDRIRKGGVSNDLVSLIDLAPTFLQVGGVQNRPQMTGKSLNDILFPDADDSNYPHRTYILTGRERHTDARPNDVGYPARAIRTKHFLFILNLKPNRWPAGNPPPPKGEIKKLSPEYNPKNFKPIGLGYNDIDDPSPTKALMIQDSTRWPQLFAEGFKKRPAEQLFDIERDPGCTTNLAYNPQFESIKIALEKKLKALLIKQGDPRMLGYGEIFDSYPRYGKMRNWGGFQQRGKYNPAFEPNKRNEK